jgi:hypothetical protein
MFLLSGNDDKIWNLQLLIKYLSDSQHGIVNLQINPEAICLNTLGLYDLLDSFSFDQVNIFTKNPFETHSCYNINYKWYNMFFSKLWTVEPQYHSWSGKKVFLGFYRRPTAARLGLAAYLHTWYKSQSTIHFSYGNGPDQLMLYEMDKLIQLNTESVGEVAQIIPHLPIWYNGVPQDLTSINQTLVDEATDVIHKEIYQDILVDIVVESHVLGKTFYPTEKTCRPMWLKKPFVVYGSKNYLKYLHQMGFKTFEDFWSEEYDDYESKDRFTRIQNLIDQISKKSTKELEQMYKGMQPILDHNYNLLLNQSYKTKFTFIK